jgi:hypothetical protein
MVLNRYRIEALYYMAHREANWPKYPVRGVSTAGVGLCTAPAQAGRRDRRQLESAQWLCCDSYVQIRARNIANRPLLERKNCHRETLFEVFQRACASRSVPGEPHINLLKGSMLGRNFGRRLSHSTCTTYSYRNSTLTLYSGRTGPCIE